MCDRGVAMEYELEAGAASGRGLVRATNQDAYALPLTGLDPEGISCRPSPGQMAAKGALFLAADGVGGRAGGEQASRTAVREVASCFYADPFNNAPTSLRRAVEAANRKIRDEGAADPESSHMATTVVALVILEDRAIIANVGDSRAYRLRGNRLRMLSQDHSWVAEQVRQGRLTAGEAAVSDLRHRISRSLGGAPSVQVDLFEETVQSGDRFLLCTDGLSGYLDGMQIARQMHRRRSAQATAEELVALAEAAGGQDNATAVVVDVGEQDEKGDRFRHAAVLAAVLILLALAGLYLGLRAWGGEFTAPAAIQGFFVVAGVVHPCVTQIFRDAHNLGSDQGLTGRALLDTMQVAEVLSAPTLSGAAE